MKKLFFTSIAITAIILSMASCGNNGAKSVSLKTQLDSLNYCIGFNTGYGIRMNYYLQNDSTGKGIAALIKAFDAAYAQKESDELFKTGQEIGSSFRRMEEDGFAGDETIKFFLSEAKAGLKAGFNGDTTRFDATSAINLVQNTMQQRQMSAYLPDSLKPAALSDKEAKDLSYALALYYGNSLKEQYQSDDTKSDKEKLASLLKGVEKSLKVKLDPKYAQFSGVGTNLGMSLKEIEKTGFFNDSAYKVNVKILRQGFINGLREYDKQMTNQETEEFINIIVQERQRVEQEKQRVENEKIYAGNRLAGEQFLAENAKRPGIVVTKSGLQYEIMLAGKGKIPTAADRVKVHYHGTLIDGTVFDSSVERDKPAVFGVGDVIIGWTEALQLMPVGSKWKLYIPQELAYGDRDMGTIKPFSALIFEVELLEIEK